MNLTRRGFLSSCLALAAAPAIVRADSLMRIVPLETTILTVDRALDVLEADLRALLDASMDPRFTIDQQKLWDAWDRDYAYYAGLVHENPPLQ